MLVLTTRTLRMEGQHFAGRLRIFRAFSSRCLRSTSLFAFRYAAISFLLVPTTSAFAEEKISFQGLDGAATRQNVLTNFPNSKVKSDCRPGESVRQSPDGEMSCFYLEDHYIIEKRDYMLWFFFSPDGKLTEASLTRMFGEPALPASEHFSKWELGQQFSALYKLLNYKYGPPLEKTGRLPEDINDCLFKDGDHGWQYQECAEWQSGTTRTYESGQNHIILELSATAPGHSTSEIKPDTYDQYEGWISISYKFIDVRSADRL